MKISLQRVSKSYQSVRALVDVSLSFGEGEIVSILGANGAGKTTLLRCVAGIASLDRGEIRFDGEILRRDRLDLRRRMFFLPDFPPLFGEHTVLRNIGMVLHLFESDRPGIEGRVMQLLKDFDLLPLSERPAFSLSRGQAYKTALVARIAADPDVWLLDEPFASGIDPQGIDALKHNVRDAAKRGRTILYSTQLLDIAERFSDRACVINEGSVRAFDSIDNLAHSAADKSNVLADLFRRLRESTTS